ncbi:MAG: arylesterase [Ginsengibacter sp.]
MNRSYQPLYILSLIFFLACNSNNTKDETAKEENKTVMIDSSTNQQTIVFFGNSLTAGYGVDPGEAYPALIQNIIDSIKLNYKVINAGVSGETSAGGNGRIDWILRQAVDVFVLELGGNDGLRGIPLAETKRNLQAIIDKVKNKYPAAKIMLEGMQIPPNMGKQYAIDFKNIYPELSTKNNTALVPFLLANVGGDARLNQQDGIHPTAEGHKIVAKNVWNVLKGIL